MLEILSSPNTACGHPGYNQEVLKLTLILVVNSGHWWRESTGDWRILLTNVQLHKIS